MKIQTDNINPMIIQWKPLNVIALGPRKTDNINRMITITDLLYSNQL